MHVMNADTMRRGLMQGPGTLKRSDVLSSFHLCAGRNALTSVVGGAASGGAGNAGAVRAERLMSEHDRQLLQIMTDNPSHDDHWHAVYHRNKLRIPLGRVHTS